jgi:protoporphyrinogen oxidase
LSLAAVKRFFPPPDDALVRAGMRGDAPTRSDYNSSFWYPTHGGIGRLVSGLATGLKDVRTNQRVTAIDLPNRLVHTPEQTFHWDILFSSIPLKSFCQRTNDRELQNAAAQLSHSSTVSLNIGLHGALRSDFKDVHWLYVPDRSVPFYRIGFYSNISKGTCSQGNSAIYVEVGVPSEEVRTLDLVKELQPTIIASLEALGWMESRAVATVVIHVIEYAYVHHTIGRETLMNLILDRLHEFGVYPIGRYGLWDYTSMEDSMESARLAVQKVF